ncbi:MAG: (Fe-S)-binding protein [Desulfopila sp.]
MVKNKTLQDYEDQIQQCVKCGVCQAHCPVYRENRREGDVARGKIALAASLLENKVGLEQNLERDISMCLMCGSCVDKCPNNVPTSEIVGAIRREITDNKGLSRIGKSVTRVIASQALMKTLTKGGALFSPLALKKIPHSSGLRLRFQTPLMNNRTLPKLPFRNLFDRVPEFIKGDADKPTVGFFAGCSITYVYPGIGESMINILKSLGYSIHIPRAQKCCGIPALSSGAGTVVEELAANNIAAFGKYDEQHIITACASCNGGIGEYYSAMKESDEDFTSRVIDFSVFLENNGVIDTLAAMVRRAAPRKVTYHDPCHLKTQGITRQPRALLRALPNVDYVEMEGASLCCGLGGTFSVHHYESSKDIGARKIPGLLDSGADTIATACPGCIMQLQDSINHAGLSVQAVHILDLIEAALTGKG